MAIPPIASLFLLQEGCGISRPLLSWLLFQILVPMSPQRGPSLSYKPILSTHSLADIYLAPRAQLCSRHWEHGHENRHPCSHGVHILVRGERVSIENGDPLLWAHRWWLQGICSPPNPLPRAQRPLHSCEVTCSSYVLSFDSIKPLNKHNLRKSSGQLSMETIPTS